MNQKTPDLTDRTARIRNAFNPQHLETLGHRLVDLLTAHLKSVQASEGSVLNWHAPPENIARAGAILDAAPAVADVSSSVLCGRFEQLVKEMLSRGHNLHDPHYIGHQVPAPVPIAGWFDAVGSVTNQVMAIYEMGPWATAVERALVERLGELVGWQRDEFAGFVTHGGSLANLTGLLTARNVAIGDAWERGLSDRSSPVLIVQQDAHYSVARAAGIIGIGTGNVVRAALNARRQMDPEKLNEQVVTLRAANRPIIAVAASACATPIGAFDPLADIADVCRRHDVWLHVDAAHGGAACFSRKYRHLLHGVEQADSLVWDAHKMMFVPALCAFVFYKDKRHRFEAFRQDAPYLFDPSAPGMADYDSGMLTPECTKRAAAYGLWGTWSLFGPSLFEDLVDATFDLTRTFYELLIEASDFEPLHEPECNILAFRHVPESMQHAPEAEVSMFLYQLRRELIQSGEFYIVQTKLDGQQALRVTVMNPLTTREDLVALMDSIRRIGRRLGDSGAMSPR